MPRLLTLTASALAVAAIAPTAAFGADNELRGHPQMHQLNASTVQVSFVTDTKLAKGSRVVVAGYGAATKATANGRHGNDYRYVARVDIRRAMTPGAKYTVRFDLGGDETLARKVLLRKRA